MQGINYSQKISDFFKPYEDEDWFNEFLETGDFCDRWVDINKQYFDEAVEIGVELARKAKNRQIWCHNEEWGAFYFIGTEQEVLNRLQKQLKAWLKLNPQKSPEEIEQECLEKSIARAESRFQSAKSELTRLKQEAKTKIKAK